MPRYVPITCLICAMQRHQFEPVIPGKSKQVSQVMADNCMARNQQTWTNEVHQLSLILPDIPKQTLNDMVLAENGNLDAIV